MHSIAQKSTIPIYGGFFRRFKTDYNESITFCFTFEIGIHKSPNFGDYTGSHGVHGRLSTSVNKIITNTHSKSFHPDSVIPNCTV